MSAVVAGAPSAPQVNLLPPEIRASRSLRSVKRLLALVLVGVMVLAVAGWAAMAMQASAAERELAAEQDETRRLLAAQQQYSEVPQVLASLDAAEQARQAGTSTEVLWREYLQTLVTTAPTDVTFTSIATTGATPTVPAPLPAHPLEQHSMLRLDFTGRSADLPDASAWMEALDAVEGFQDSYVSSLTITEGTSAAWSGRIYYEVTGSVQITAEAFAGRFADEEESDG